MIKRWLALAIGIVWALGAGADSPPAAGVRIVDSAWSRATPPGVTVGAAFFSLQANANDRLLRASSTIAARVEIHSMTLKDGLLQMRPLPSLELPAGRRVELSPEGTHLMLLGLKQPLEPQSQFPLTLTFEHAGEQTLSVQVRPLGQ